MTAKMVNRTEHGQVQETFCYVPGRKRTIEDGVLKVKSLCF